MKLIQIVALTAFMAICSAGCSSMKPGKMAWVRPESDQPRAGNVYLLRGWIGIFSTGIDNLTEQLNKNGVRAHVYQDDQWRSLANTIKKNYRDGKHEPLVLVGHSYGADDVVRIARRLNDQNIRVDLLVTLDPVTPPAVPKNVKLCVNLYQSNGVADVLPFLRGVPLSREEDAPHTALVNSDLRKDRPDLLEPGTDHFNIEKKGKIHDEVVRQVLGVCPPRQQWLAMQRARGGSGVSQFTAPAPTAVTAPRPVVASDQPPRSANGD